MLIQSSVVWGTVRGLLLNFSNKEHICAGKYLKLHVGEFVSERGTRIERILAEYPLFSYGVRKKGFC